MYLNVCICLQESPLTILTSFLYRCIYQRIFDLETGKLLSKFLQHCQRKYSMDTTAIPYQLSKEALQRLAVSLVKIALSHSFDSAFHQREFLRCLATAQFEKGLMGKCFGISFFVCIYSYCFTFYYLFQYHLPTSLHSTRFCKYLWRHH